MSEGLSLAVWLSKPLLYFGVFWLARAWSAEPLGISRWRPVLAALVRAAGGIVVGIPVALLASQLGPPGVMVAFTCFRIGLWLGVMKLFFTRLSVNRAVLLSLGAAALNWGIDLVVFGGSWTNMRGFGG